MTVHNCGHGKLSAPRPTVTLMLDIDRTILDIAGRFYIQPGSRENAIRTETGRTPIRFYQALNRLIDDPEACLEYPEVTARLRRQRNTLTQQRRAG